MIAIVLIAGVGSRLYPLTKETPKCLLHVQGQPILGRLLHTLEQAGIRRAHLVTGYRAEQITAFVHAHPIAGLEVSFSHNAEYDRTNNAYSLSLALATGIDEFLLIDGDLVFQPDLLNKLLRADAENAMLVDADPSRLTEEAMKAQTDAQGRIVRLSKSMDFGKAAGEFIGLARFGKTIARNLTGWMARMTPDQRAHAYYEDGLNAVMAGSPPLLPVLTDGLPWTEIDTREDLEAANRERL